MTTMMILKDSDWTLDGFAASFAEGETSDVALDAANTAHAWLINNLHPALPYGWIFRGGAFEGPYTPGLDAAGAALSLITQAVDYVVENLDEIRAEAAQEAAANRD